MVELEEKGGEEDDDSRDVEGEGGGSSWGKSREGVRMEKEGGGPSGGAEGGGG